MGKIQSCLADSRSYIGEVISFATSAPIEVPQDRVLSSQETIIVNKEHIIPFPRSSARAINATISKYSKHGKLSRQEFLRAHDELGMSLKSEMEDPGSAIYRFYSNVREGNLFDVKSLILAGILLGSGSKQEKAEVLFNLYNDDHDQDFERDEVYRMLQQIVDMSAEYLPLLAIGEEQGCLSEDQYTDISTKMLDNKEPLVAYLHDHILEKQPGIKSPEFINKISNDPELGEILFSSGVRSLLMKRAERRQR